MRDLLSAAFPSTQVYYFLRLVEFVNEPFRSKPRSFYPKCFTKGSSQYPPLSLIYYFYPSMPKIGNQDSACGFKIGCHNIVNNFPLFSYPGCVSSSLAAPPWQTGCLTTAGGSSNGLQILPFCAHASTSIFRMCRDPRIPSDFDLINAAIDPDIMTAPVKDEYYGDAENSNLDYVCKFASSLADDIYDTPTLRLMLNQSCPSCWEHTITMFSMKNSGLRMLYNLQRAPFRPGW